MQLMKRQPTTPGAILNEEFLKPLKITPKNLADCIGCDYKIIDQIINEKARISTPLAEKLAIVFKTSPDFWLNAQNTVDLWKPNQRDF